MGKKSVKVFHLSDSSDDDQQNQERIPSPARRCTDSLEDGEERGVSLNPTSKETHVQAGESKNTIVYRCSAMDALLKSTGHSELSRFIRNKDFRFEQVSCLPPTYNGNVVFELPPILGMFSKGERLRDMDRSKDCYIWTRIFPTSVNVQPKKLWEFGKVTCTGSIECQNNLCEYLERKKGRNARAWSGIPKLSRQYVIGKLIEEGGIVCHYCQKVPFCKISCLARMFYMYPQLLAEPDTMKFMSRLAIHMGVHNHPSRKTWSRVAEKMVHSMIKKQHEANPSATPSGIKNVVTGSMVKTLCESVEDIYAIEESKIWESLMLVSTPQKFVSLFQSVRQDQKGHGELEFLVQMQKNVKFPFLQRYLLPGQGCREDRAHIFKMTIKGEGSGVDLLRQMQPGGV